MTCIWCKRVKYKASVEHIFPDSLGCPEEMVLCNGEVCERCNNKLAKLDQALVSELEMFRFCAGVPNKRGKSPRIATHPNIAAAHMGDGPHIYINEERHSVDSPIGRISARRKDSKFRVGRVTSSGMAGSITIEQRGILNCKKAVRGLHKIGLELICREIGAVGILADRFNAVRAYVLRGRGERRVLLFGNSTYINRAWSTESSNFGSDVAAFQLTVIGCVVDLSPEQEHIERLKRMALLKHGPSGWTWVPIPP